MKLKFLCLLFLFLTININLSAQQFKTVQKNPFGMLKSDTLSLQGFALVDMDKDGLKDLLYTDEVAFNTFMLLNQGTIGQPKFTNSLILDFELPSGNGGLGRGELILSSSKMVDFDNDGDIDYLDNYISDSPNNLPPYIVKLNQPELIPSANFEFFLLEETELNAYGIPYIPLYTYENFDYRDVDADGKKDILGSRSNEDMVQHEFVFYKRLSDSLFAPPVVTPFGLESIATLYGQPCLIDPDGDGDMDMFVLKGEGDWLYFKNEGTATLPNFALPVSNPFNLTPLDEYGFVVLAIDINNDGKEDLMAMGPENFYYFEFDNDSSVKNLKNKPEFSIVPNLVSDFCSIKTTESAQIKKIEIRTIQNSLVYESTVMQELHLGHLPKGMYQVVAYFEDGSLVSKMISKM